MLIYAFPLFGILTIEQTLTAFQRALVSITKRSEEPRIRLSGNSVNRDDPLYNQLPKERAMLDQCHRAAMALFQRP